MKTLLATETSVLIADPLALPIAKGIAGPGLLAETVVKRWCDHQPLHRQESSPRPTRLSSPTRHFSISRQPSTATTLAKAYTEHDVECQVSELRDGTIVCEPSVPRASAFYDETCTDFVRVGLVYVGADHCERPALASFLTSPYVEAPAATAARATRSRSAATATAAPRC